MIGHEKLAPLAGASGVWPRKKTQKEIFQSHTVHKLNIVYFLKSNNACFWWDLFCITPFPWLFPFSFGLFVVFASGIVSITHFQTFSNFLRDVWKWVTALSSFPSGARRTCFNAPCDVHMPVHCELILHCADINSSEYQSTMQNELACLTIFWYWQCCCQACGNNSNAACCCLTRVWEWVWISANGWKHGKM